MKRILRKAGAGLLTLLLSAAYVQAGQDAGAKQKEFDELLARVKKSDAAVDFGHRDLVLRRFVPPIVCRQIKHRLDEIPAAQAQHQS